MWRVSRTKCGEPGRFRSRSRVAHVIQMLLTAWTVSKQEGRLGVRPPDDPREVGQGLRAPPAKNGHQLSEGHERRGYGSTGRVHDQNRRTPGGVEPERRPPSRR